MSCTLKLSFVSAFTMAGAAVLVACSSSGSDATSGSQQLSAALPQGVHLTSGGRYIADVCDHSQKHFCLTERLLPEGWTPADAVPKPSAETVDPDKKTTTTAPTTGLAPADVLAGYDLSATTSTVGAIVAIIDEPDSHALSDLAAYRKAYGLPALPKCAGLPDGKTPCFAQVDQTGGTSTGTDPDPDADVETSLDMDMISAGCPSCSILLVEFNNSAETDFTVAAATAAKLGAVATSISFGGPEAAGDIQGFTTAGHLVLAASGDFGYDNVNFAGTNTSSPSWPSSAPDLVAVGGTALFKLSNGYDEGVWNDGTFSTGQDGQDITTSGCSTEFAQPSWQTSALSGTTCTKRATADLSASAAFYSGTTSQGINAYNAAEGGFIPVEGTSASSPLVAAILARLGLAETISSDLSYFYTHAADFNDLGSSAYPVDKSGSSTDSQTPSSCGKLCSVGTGWDGPSGVGTPNGTKLAADSN